jgi:predicted permease
MPSLEDGTVPPFLGALQACTSVLLTLLYGIIARQANIIHEKTINDMSGLCVRLFLPAMIMVKLGSELHIGIAMNYVPVFSAFFPPSSNNIGRVADHPKVWSISYTAISVVMGYTLSRLLRLPQWVTPTVSSNNTSSLPLLLLETLLSTGSLGLITPPGQTQEDAVNRAQSYFLVCAVTTKTISYAIGPRMLRDMGNEGRNRNRNRQPEDDVDSENQTTNVQQQQQQDSSSNNNHNTCNGTTHSPTDQEEEEAVNEHTSLLPTRVQIARHKTHSAIRYIFSFFPKTLRRGLNAIDSPFLDAALCCTATGVLVGLVPKLHHAFFASYEDGGIFHAWLTSSIENIGRLFTSLQVFLVGCKLGVSFEKMRRSKHSGNVPVRALLVVFCVRLIIWPACVSLFLLVVHLYCSIYICSHLIMQNQHFIPLSIHPLHENPPARPNPLVQYDGDANRAAGPDHLGADRARRCIRIGEDGDCKGFGRMFVL